MVGIKVLVRYGTVWLGAVGPGVAGFGLEQGWAGFG